MAPRPSPSRITVKGMATRYQVSERTAVRWRRELVAAGILARASRGGHTLLGHWDEIDRELLSGRLAS